MIRLSEIKLPLAAARSPDTALHALAAQTLGLRPRPSPGFGCSSAGFDARKARPAGRVHRRCHPGPSLREAALLASIAGNPHIQPTPDMVWRPVGQAPAGLPQRPVVVGFGPCGIFAALVLAQMGFKPDRAGAWQGRRERTQDTWGLWRKRALNPESNVQFGEGGAGTFSDGKLYSQIKDPRHLGRKVLQRVRQGRRARRDLVRRPPAHRHLPAW